MVSGYSRWLSAVLVPSRHAAGPVRGLVAAHRCAGGVPRALVWDGEGAIGRWRAGKPELTAECQAFRGTLGTRVVVCRPADPEAKGLVERANGYLETSFLPGRAFASPADFNAQLAEWLRDGERPGPAGAGLRPGRPHRRRPAGDADPAAGRAGDRVAGLAAAAPRPLRPAGLQRLLRPPGRDRPRIEVVAGLDRVRVWCGGQLAADHERAWAWHQVITDPEHKAAAAGHAAAAGRDAAAGRARAGSRAAPPGRLRRRWPRRRRGAA